MIGKYNEKYYNIIIKPDFVKIWTYEEISEFRKRDLPTNKTIYEKYIDYEELTEIFDAWFSVKYKGSWHIAAYDRKTDKINFVKNLDNNSQVYQAYLLEKGLCSKSINPEKCEGFKLYKKYLEDNKKEVIDLTLEEFKKYYNIMKENLTSSKTQSPPPQNFGNKI